MRRLRQPKILEASYIDVTEQKRLSFDRRAVWFARGLVVMGMLAYLVI